MSKSLAIRDDIDILTLADMLVKSGFFTDTRQQAQAVVKVLAGAELGFGPIASMTGIHVVKGKPVLSANLMGAAVKRSGRYDYCVTSHTDAECTIAFSDGGRKIGESTFTIEDAKRAGLTGGDNWKKYPKNMLFARALSNGARWYCPDVLGGPIYTPDEMGVPVDESGTAIIEADEWQDVTDVTNDDESFTDVRDIARRSKHNDNGNGEPLTLETAAALTTSNGTAMGDLSADQLQWIIDNPDKASDRKVDAAKLLMGELMKDDDATPAQTTFNEMMAE